jgi:uncharacterized membrane protein
MPLPAIREKISQLPRSHLVLFLLFFIIILVVLGESGFYFIKIRPRMKENRVKTILANSEGTMLGELSSILKEKLVIEVDGKAVDVFYNDIDLILLADRNFGGSSGTILVHRLPIEISELEIGRTIIVIPRK